MQSKGKLKKKKKKKINYKTNEFINWLLSYLN